MWWTHKYVNMWLKWACELKMNSMIWFNKSNILVCTLHVGLHFALQRYSSWVSRLIERSQIVEPTECSQLLSRFRLRLVNRNKWPRRGVYQPIFNHFLLINFKKRCTHICANSDIFISSKHSVHTISDAAYCCIPYSAIYRWHLVGRVHTMNSTW